MNHDIFANLVAGRLGRATIFSRKPIFYLNEESLVNIYFEDLPSGDYANGVPDGYAGGLVNVDKSAQTLTVKIGTRGGAAIIQEASWTNLDTAVAITQSFANHKAVFKFTPTPVSGYWTVGLAGAATLPTNTTYPTGAAVPPLSPYLHTVFRDTTSGKIFAEAAEADLEEALTAMFREIVSGIAGNYTADSSGYDGIPDSDSWPDLSANPTTWAGYSLEPGEVIPRVVASIVADNEWNVLCYIPDFQLNLIHVFDSSSNSKNGIPDSDAHTITADPTTWSQVVATVAGKIDLSGFAVNNINLLGPAGKTGSLVFTDPAFATLLGSNAAVDLWMEMTLDDGITQTVAAGTVELRKPMT